MGILRWKDVCREGSWNGIKMPIQVLSFDDGHVLALHTYPDVPGQEVEPQGRQGATFDVTVVYSPDLSTYWGENIYPEGPRTLRRALETGGTATLVHPIWGEFECHPLRWNVVDDASRPDMTIMRVTFVEDSLEPFTLTDSTALSKTGDAAKKADEIDLILAQEHGYTDLNPFRDILDAFNAVLYAWNSTWYAIESMLLRIRGQIRDLIDLLDLDSADNWGDVRPLIIEFQADLIEAANAIEVDRPMFSQMTVGMDTNLYQISVDLYGNKDEVETLHSLNASVVANPNHVPAGTVLVYQIP
jgi:prophage DNA circulation protein